MIGLAVVSLFGIHTEENSYGAWMDPGAFALVGAASFFGGVSRLTMSLAVIMVCGTVTGEFVRCWRVEIALHSVN
jgi:chloride channel 7